MVVISLALCFPRVGVFFSRVIGFVKILFTGGMSDIGAKILRTVGIVY